LRRWAKGVSWEAEDLADQAIEQLFVTQVENGYAIGSVAMWPPTRKSAEVILRRVWTKRSDVKGPRESCTWPFYFEVGLEAVEEGPSFVSSS
jgi:hypothetical protein